jgi:ammonia channel protein AmtB
VSFSVDSITAVAFLNTDIAASFGAVAWLVVEWCNSRKPHFLGLLTGAVAALATITPAAGYVSPAVAVLIGTVAGVVCYYAVALKNHLKWDDALDVWGVHGVGGTAGDRHARHFRLDRVEPGRHRAEWTDYCAEIPSSLAFSFIAVMISSIWAFRLHALHALADRPGDACQGHRSD